MCQPIGTKRGEKNVKRSLAFSLSFSRSIHLVVAENSKVTKWTRREFNKNEYFIFDECVRKTARGVREERTTTKEKKKMCFKNYENSSLPFFSLRGQNVTSWLLPFLLFTCKFITGETGLFFFYLFAAIRPVIFLFFPFRFDLIRLYTLSSCRWWSINIKLHPKTILTSYRLLL